MDARLKKIDFTLRSVEDIEDPTEQQIEELAQFLIGKSDFDRSHPLLNQNRVINEVYRSALDELSQLIKSLNFDGIVQAYGEGGRTMRKTIAMYMFTSKNPAFTSIMIEAIVMDEEYGYAFSSYPTLNRCSIKQGLWSMHKVYDGSVFSFCSRSIESCGGPQSAFCQPMTRVTQEPSVSVTA